MFQVTRKFENCGFDYDESHHDRNNTCWRLPNPFWDLINGMPKLRVLKFDLEERSGRYPLIQHGDFQLKLQSESLQEFSFHSNSPPRGIFFHMDDLHCPNLKIINIRQRTLNDLIVSFVEQHRSSLKKLTLFFFEKAEVDSRIENVLKDRIKTIPQLDFYITWHPKAYSLII